MHRIVLSAVIVLWPALVRAERPPSSEGWVVLGVDEYRSLHDKAYPPTPAPDKPAIEATLTRLDYDLRVTGDSAVGEARLTVDVFKEGWVRIPLPTGLRLRAARLEGRPVALDDGPAGTKAPGLSLLLRNPGRKAIVLEIGVPLQSSAGAESLSLPTSGAALCRATLAVPRDGLDVKLSGALLAESSSTKGETRWVADGSGAAALAFTWQRRTEDHRAQQPLRLRGSVTQYVGLAEDAAQLNAEVRLEVVHGAATQLALSLPEGLSITQVSGANVGDWDVKAERLLVTFLEPVENAETISVVGEARVPREGSFAVPFLRLRDAERETGGVAVEVLGAGEIKSPEAHGLDRTDAQDLGGLVARRDSPLLAAFRFRALEGGAPRSLNVTVERYTPQAVLLAMAEEARYDALVTDEGKTLVRGRYAVRNNQQSFLVVKLPENATLWSASVGGRPVRPGRSAEGAFLVPLEKGRAGEEAPAFPVEIVYLERGPAWSPEGHARLQLPALDLPVSRTGVVLYRSPSYRVKLNPSVFREEAYAAPLSPALQPLVATHENDMGYGQAAAKRKSEAGADGFADRLQAVNHRSLVGGILPLSVPFPVFGDVLFLVSELTKEGEMPTIDIAYKRTKGGRS
jgi:hypothetical protein